MIIRIRLFLTHGKRQLTERNNSRKFDSCEVRLPLPDSTNWANLNRSAKAIWSVYIYCLPVPIEIIGGQNRQNACDKWCYGNEYSRKSDCRNMLIYFLFALHVCIAWARTQPKMLGYEIGNIPVLDLMFSCWQTHKIKFLILCAAYPFWNSGGG